MTAWAPDAGLVDAVRAAVADELAARAHRYQQDGHRLEEDDQRALAAQLIGDHLERHARSCLAAHQPLLGEVEETAVTEAVIDVMFEAGRLQPLLEDERLTNITANGCDRVFVETADGDKFEAPPIARSDAEMIEMLRDIGRRHGLSEREFNPAHPELNVQLPDGSRLFAVAWVCARPCLAIRRHRYLRLTLDDLERLGTIDAGLRSFLAAAVVARLQIVISGGTDTGKTTFLRALSTAMSPAERIVTIESELELGLDRYPDLHPDCIAFEAREANVEGTGEVEAARLVRMSLRMRPDRVIVGECRGDEVIPMLQAMNQGNAGSLCTIHADSSATVFNKLVTYAMQAPQRMDPDTTTRLASDAIDLLIHLVKAPGGRVVTSIRHIAGYDGQRVLTNELFRPGPDLRAVTGSPIPADLLARLVDAGYDPSFHLPERAWR